MSFTKIAVLGAGSWGTALANLWGQRGHALILWGHNPERAERLRQTRVNDEYLPGVHLPENIQVTHELAECAAADLIVFVTPSVALREIAGQLRAVGLRDESVLLSCTKGIEHRTGMRMTQILEEIFPGNTSAVMSGPNLALEVSRNLPTATVIGCPDNSCAERLQQQLGSSRFRIYSSRETTAIELGGALKNVFAIPAGANDALGLGDNSKAALVTRSLAEMVRLGTAMGGDTRTFHGLSGIGDLDGDLFQQPEPQPSRRAGTGARAKAERDPGGNAIDRGRNPDGAQRL